LSKNCAQTEDLEVMFI